MADSFRGTDTVPVITVQPLTADAFAPYGDVLTIPTTTARYDADAALASLRPGARPRLSLSQRDAVSLPLQIRQKKGTNSRRRASSR